MNDLFDNGRPSRGTQLGQGQEQGQGQKKIGGKTFNDFWLYVIIAFVVGLMIPDKSNPYEIIRKALTKKDDKTEDKDKKGTDTPEKKD